MNSLPQRIDTAAPPAILEELPALPVKARRWLEAYLSGEAPQQECWEALSPTKREVALSRKQMAEAVLRLERGGVSRNRAVERLRLDLLAGSAPEELCRVASRLGRKGAPPSRSRLYAWANDYEAKGLMSLVAQHKGSRPTIRGWEQPALALWLRPTRQDPGSIAFVLRQTGYAATRVQVAKFIGALPKNLGQDAPQRAGAHYYRQNITPYTIRDYSNIPVGLVYEGDGHTCDTYVAHPESGNPFRAELTPWIDWKSHKVAGWFLWNRESGLNTLFSLSHALLSQDHVPALIHVDPGSGFKNRMMTEKTSGWCAKFSVRFMPALPGNARGKGLIEGFFKHYEARLGKLFETYCGHCRTDDALSRLRARIKRGELSMPTFLEYYAAVNWYIESYNRNPQEALGGRSPNEVWDAELERVPVELRQAAVLRPSAKNPVVVRKFRVRLLNRVFESHVLAEWEGDKVIVEMDIHDLTRVYVYSQARRFICEAQLVEQRKALPDSLIQEIEQDRTAGRIERKKRDIQEIEIQAGLAITHETTLNNLAELGEPDHPTDLEQADSDPLLNELLQQEIGKATAATAAPPQEQEIDIDIDILDTSYAPRSIEDESD